MLYTVRPLERIYANPDTFDSGRHGDGNKFQAGSSSQDKTEAADYKEVLLPNGRIVTRRNGEGYIIERLHSTDMRDYLNQEYAPGQNYQ